MAGPYFWVLSSGTWNNASTTNWSASSGGAPAAGPPLSTDNVNFDANSGLVAPFTVTMGTSATCANMTAGSLAFTMTWAGSTAMTIAGSLSLPASNFTRTYTGAITFSAKSSVTTTMNGVTLASNLTFAGSGGTWALQDDLTTTGTLTFGLGTVSLGSHTLSGSTLAAGAVGAAGTISFGTGKISLSGNAGTVVNVPSFGSSNVTITGAPLVKLTYAGGTGTRTIVWGNTGTVITSTTALGLLIGSGTDTVALPSSSSSGLGAVDFTGFKGTLSNTAFNIYGNLTFDSGMTLTAGSSLVSFLGSSATNTLTTNGLTLDFPLAIGSGGNSTVQLAGDLTLGSTRNLAVNSGTFDPVSHNVTIASLTAPSGTSRTLKLGSGKWTVSGSGTSWNPTASSLAVIDSGSTISLTSASAKTFAGVGRTYGVLDNGGAGALTVTGSNNAFHDITSTGFGDIDLTAGTTTTLDQITLSGNVSHQVKLQSATAATHTISIASGTQNLSYVTITNSIATGGATFNAFTSNGCINGGGNTGWNFTAPVADTGNGGTLMGLL